MGWRYVRSRGLGLRRSCGCGAAVVDGGCHRGIFRRGLRARIGARLARRQKHDGGARRTGADRCLGGVRSSSITSCAKTWPAIGARSIRLAHELTARAIMPGSALACLDAMAGEAVESSCEKALFATPEATAAAVSYVGAQLSLLAAGHAQAHRLDPGRETMLARSAPWGRARPFRHRGARARGAGRLHARVDATPLPCCTMPAGCGRTWPSALTCLWSAATRWPGCPLPIDRSPRIRPRWLRKPRPPGRWPRPSHPAICFSRRHPRSRPSAS